MKRLFKITGLILSFLFVFSSCGSTEVDADTYIRDTEIEYIMKFDISAPHGYHYAFYLTKDELLAYYEEQQNVCQEVRIKLSELEYVNFDERVERILLLDKTDIEGYGEVTDYWTVTLTMNGDDIYFDYGASKNTDVNILLEQIIGICDFKEEYKEALVPYPTHLRQMYERIEKESCY